MSVLSHRSGELPSFLSSVACFGAGLLVPILLTLFLWMPVYSAGDFVNVDSGRSILTAYGQGMMAAWIALFGLFAFVWRAAAESDFDALQKAAEAPTHKVLEQLRLRLKRSLGAIGSLDALEGRCGLSRELEKLAQELEKIAAAKEGVGTSIRCSDLLSCGARYAKRFASFDWHREADIRKVRDSLTHLRLLMQHIGARGAVDLRREAKTLHSRLARWGSFLGGLGLSWVSLSFYPDVLLQQAVSNSADAWFPRYAAVMINHSLPSPIVGLFIIGGLMALGFGAWKGGKEFSEYLSLRDRGRRMAGHLSDVEVAASRFEEFLGQGLRT